MSWKNPWVSHAARMSSVAVGEVKDMMGRENASAVGTILRDQLER